MTQLTNYSVNAIKIGNCVSISLNGKLHKKSCSSAIESDELFRLAQITKENPTDENINNIRLALNDRTRIAMKCGLEADNETGEVFLAGFNTPIPDKLVEIIKEYYDNNYPVTAIINFWKLLMINPDTRVRTSLFDFISVHDFVITDSGYFIAYKAVKRVKTISKANDEENDYNNLVKYVEKQWYHVKKDWRCSPTKYMIYKCLTDGAFRMTKESTSRDWDEKKLKIQFMGNLDELYDDIQNFRESVSVIEDINNVYTDKHTNQMHIQLGIPVIQRRGACDANPGQECSVGLHIGSTLYVEHFASNGDAVLICYVNPANVVSVPDHDKSKIRVCEYFPYAEAEYVEGKINIIKQSYYENDYCAYEAEALTDMIINVQANEKPIERAHNGMNEETRSMSELKKILENRLVVLSEID